MVRSPVSLYLPGSTATMRLERKVIVGYLSTSKKSALRKCASRLATWVLTVVASRLTTPVTLLNSPLTFEIIMWRTENCAKEWAGSICQSVLWANDGTASATSRADATTKRVVILDMAFLLLSLDDKRLA